MCKACEMSLPSRRDMVKTMAAAVGGLMPLTVPLTASWLAASVPSSLVALPLVSGGVKFRAVTLVEDPRAPTYPVMLAFVPPTW